MTKRVTIGAEPSTRLIVRVHPGARTNHHAWGNDDVVHIWVIAPAVDGAANRAVIRYLAEAIGLPQNRVFLEHGATSRTKRFCVMASQAEVVQRLSKPATS